MTADKHVVVNSCVLKLEALNCQLRNIEMRNGEKIEITGYTFRTCILLFQLEKELESMTQLLNQNMRRWRMANWTGKL